MDNLINDQKPTTAIDIWLCDLTYTGQDTQSIGADTIPMAIGSIATYAEKHIDFEKEIKLFRYPEKVHEAIRVYGAPDIFCFANYVWNFELSYEVASIIKDLNPEAIIIAGGPNYPLDEIGKSKFLQQQELIDFYVLHEGEVAFCNLLKSVIGYNMDKSLVKAEVMPSVNFIGSDGELKDAGEYAPRIKNLDEIPSPYTTGKLDEFFDGRLIPLLQTKRGCPFQCTFCVEGTKYYTKVSKYIDQRLEDEINYMGRKMHEARKNGGRNDLQIADSNFGMYTEDILVANALAGTMKKYEWPDHINGSTGKNKKERVIEVASILQGKIVLSGSVQTLTEEVLENIKRKNISANDLMDLAQDAKAVDANSYCEIILGLPGETLESHFDTIQYIVTAGFNKVIPYQLMLLHGSELNSVETRKKYQMQSRFRVLPRAFGKYEMGDREVRIADIEEICVSTNTLSFEDYVKCRRFHLVLSVFYNDVVFDMSIKILKSMGISVYKWLYEVYELIDASSLKDFFNEFDDRTRNELWESKDELKQYVKEGGTVELYQEGKAGFNLLQTYKARALSLHLALLHDVSLKAINNIMGPEKAEEVEFISSAMDWDLNRIKNVFDNHKEIPVTEYAYDFIKLNEAQNFSDFKKLRTHQRPYKFVLDDTQEDIINTNLRVFGNDSNGIGRLLSHMHTSNLFRKCEYA